MLLLLRLILLLQKQRVEGVTNTFDQHLAVCVSDVPVLRLYGLLIEASCIKYPDLAILQVFLLLLQLWLILAHWLLKDIRLDARHEAW